MRVPKLDMDFGKPLKRLKTIEFLIGTYLKYLVLSGYLQNFGFNEISGNTLYFRFATTLGFSEQIGSVIGKHVE